MYNILSIKSFDKDVVRYHKKFPKITDDIRQLKRDLFSNPHLGIPLGFNTYKIRVKNSSINKGKSAGYRVITYIIDKNQNIFLLKIYSKNDIENISNNELIELVKQIKQP